MALHLAMFAVGLFAWTFLEYTIHGILCHIFATFATPLHHEHHRDPHAVFSAGAWFPFAVVSVIVFEIFGLTLATTIWLGVVTGFLCYEFFHYRIHFARPICQLEDRLRTRHLAHHFREPTQIFGVTNRIWDRTFASEPDDARLAEMQASVALTQPLRGASNFRLIFRSWFYLSQYQSSSQAPESSIFRHGERRKRNRKDSETPGTRYRSEASGAVQSFRAISAAPSESMRRSSESTSVAPTRGDCAEHWPRCYAVRRCQRMRYRVWSGAYARTSQHGHSGISAS